MWSMSLKGKEWQTSKHCYDPISLSHLSENLKVVLASERESRGQRWRDAVDDEIAVVVQENGRTVVLGGDLEGHLGTAES